MKETRMPPAQSANLVANSGNTIYGVSVITILRWYIDEHQGLDNTSLKDEVHTTDIIKYAIQVKSLSERDRFTVNCNNSITKQHEYHLLNKLQYDEKQYGRRSKMADISIWRTFQNGGLSTKKPIWREFQYCKYFNLKKDISIRQ